MSRSTSRTLAVFTIVVGLLVAAVAIPVQPVRGGARAWAKSLSDSSRLEIVRSGRLQGLPVVYRQALFSELRTPAERAEAWRGVFAAFRQTRTISPQEDRILARAEALISPELFAGRRTAAQRAAIAEVRQEIERRLGNDAMRYLYKSFGPTGDVTTAMPVGERALWAIRTVSDSTPYLGRLNASIRDCYCNRAADNDCSGGQHCRSPQECNEREPWWGCGDADWCDALCSFDGQN